MGTYLTGHVDEVSAGFISEFERVSGKLLPARKDSLALLSAGVFGGTRWK